MNMKKTAFLLSLGLSVGLGTLSGASFAADSTAKKPTASKPMAKPKAHDMNDHCDMHDSGKVDGKKSGMMGDRMMSGHMDGEMCDHEGGMMGGDHKSGMMGDHMGGKMCDQEGGMTGGGHMSGMMGGYGSGMMLESPQMNLVKSLDLSGEQRSKINKLYDTLKHNNWATMGLIMDESAKLRDLYEADKRDPSAIGQTYQKIFDSQRKMIEAMIDTQNHVDELLTPEQRTRLKNLHHKMKPMHGYSMH